MVIKTFKFFTQSIGSEISACWEVSRGNVTGWRISAFSAGHLWPVEWRNIHSTVPRNTMFPHSQTYCTAKEGYFFPEPFRHSKAMLFVCQYIILMSIMCHKIHLLFLIGHFSEHEIQNAYVSFRQMWGTHISKYACPGWANLLSSPSLTLSVTFSSALGSISERDCVNGVP